MVQAAFFDGISFDPFAFEQDCLPASEVDISRGEIVEALVVSAMIVMLNESGDLSLEILLEELVFEQDAVLERLVPAFDSPLRLRMARSAMDLADLIFLSPFTKVGSDVTRTVIRQQAGTMLDLNRVTA